MDSIEKKIGKSEAEVQELRHQLRDPAIMSNTKRLKALYRRL